MFVELAGSHMEIGVAQVHVPRNQRPVQLFAARRQEAQVAADEALEQRLAMQAEEAAGYRIARRRGGARAIADRAAHQHGRNALDQQHLCGGMARAGMRLQQAEVLRVTENGAAQLVPRGLGGAAAQL
ncbi:hypothetical protein D3C76_1102580 [compost metagenome]